MSNNIEGLLISKVLAWSRLLLALLITIILSPFGFIYLKLVRRSPRGFVRLFFRIICWVIGLKVELKTCDGHGNKSDIDSSCDVYKEIITGDRGDKVRVLYVSNHVSYLDILSLRAFFDVRFVAKGDMEDWTFLGWLATINETLFFNRSMRESSEQVSRMEKELEGNGMDVLIFPEGTTGGGLGTLNFKSSLFDALPSVAKNKTLILQPLSVFYSRIDNVPLTHFERDFIAWVGDEGFYPHIVRCLGLGCITVEIIIHESRQVGEHEDRKNLSKWSEKTIDRGLSQS